MPAYLLSLQLLLLKVLVDEAEMEVVDCRHYSQDVGYQHSEFADFVEEYGPITANIPVVIHVVDTIDSVAVILIVGEE